MKMTKRDYLGLMLGAASAAISAGSLGPKAVFAQNAAPAPDVFKLPPLGYGFDALEPYIDTTTMMIHHDRHHGAYVANMNQLVPRWPDLATIPMETVLSDLTKVPEPIRTGVRNNLGGHWNHSQFWQMMAPGGAKAPAGDLKTAIDATFGSLDTLVEKLNGAATSRFGSGWAWLVVNPSKKLDIISTANQDTPLELGSKAILAIDVWEHAYYLKYQNRRADYLKAWWNVANWDKAAENFKLAAG
jgi:superoxide dismutase, Fe-Mn family